MGNWWDGITNAAGNVEGGLVDAFTGGSYSKLKAAGQATNTIPQPQFQPAGGPRTDTTGLLAPGASMPSLAGNSHMPTGSQVAPGTLAANANYPTHAGGQVTSYGPGGSATPIAMPTPGGGVTGSALANKMPAIGGQTPATSGGYGYQPPTPAPSSPAPASLAPSQPAADPGAGTLLANLNKGFQTGQGIVGKVDALGNSYDTNGAGFQGYLAGQLGRTADSFAGADHQLRAELAASGMLGGGAEASGYANIAAQRSNAMAQTQSQAYQDAMDKGNQFNLDRYGLEASANNGAMSGGLGLLSGQSQAGLTNQEANRIAQLLPSQVKDEAAKAGLTQAQADQAQWIAQNQGPLALASFLSNIAGGVLRVAGATAGA